jgi:hypothetical protein
MRRVRELLSRSSKYVSLWTSNIAFGWQQVVINTAYRLSLKLVVLLL